MELNLTERAFNYLKKQERREDAIREIQDIEKAFKIASIKPTEELIKFQSNYGGLNIYAGLEPICFGIIHGNLIRGSEFRGEKNKLVYDYSEENPEILHFYCADTLYQEEFTIDEKGNYYEGWEKLASNFDYVIEDLAVFNEVSKLNLSSLFDSYFDYKEIDIFSIIKLLNLKDYPKFPFDLTYWGRNENYVARITRNRILILGKKELSDDTKNHLKRIIK